MRYLRKALVAASLSLAVASPAAAQATYTFAGCNEAGNCGTAVLMIHAMRDATVHANVQWNDGVGGQLFGQWGVQLLPSSWPGTVNIPGLFSDYIWTGCTAGHTGTARTECVGIWQTDFMTVPIGYQPTALEIRIGYGVNPDTWAPLSVGVLTLHITPEPATVALLGGGLLALGSIGAVRGRRQM